MDLNAYSGKERSAPISAFFLKMIVFFINNNLDLASFKKIKNQCDGAVAVAMWRLGNTKIIEYSAYFEGFPTG